jgi:hypothetical protein
MAGADDSRRPFETVDFAAADPADSVEGLEGGSRVRRSGGLAAGAIGAAIAAALVVHLAGADHSARQPTSHADAPQPHPQPAPDDVNATVPTRAIVSAFQDHLPGSIVVTEQTVQGLTHGRSSVQRRVITAVTGNVFMTLTIAPTGTAVQREQRSSHVAVQHGFLMRFAFKGYYAPSGAKLRALAADPRLVSLETKDSGSDGVDPAINMYY